MKRVILCLTAVLLYVSSAFAQDGKTIYNKYSGKEGMSAVYISSAMFGLMKNMPDITIDDNNVNFNDIIRTFKGMYILSTDDRQLAGSIQTDVMRLVGTGKYELLMEAKDGAENMQIYVVLDGNIVSDFIMTSDDGSYTVISITAEMPFEELQKLLKDM